MKSSNLSTRLILLLLVAAGGYFGLFHGESPSIATPQSGAPAQRTPETPTGGDGDRQVERAFENRLGGLQVQVSGAVVKLLPDDRDGSRHQRFLIRLDSGRTLLVAHNIDLAPRVEGLAANDTVELFGEYEWNDRGGVIHWTHRDPRGSHADGWIRHRGRLYQ